MLDLKQPWVKVATLLLCALVLMASGGIQSAYNLIESGGTPITKRQTVNFTGTGVSCADSGGISVCTINGAGVANFSQAFTNQTSVTITHNLGTSSVLVQCQDNSSPPNVITPATIAITSINVVTVTFSTSQSGTCIVNGAAAGTATSVPFSGITSATNTTAAMVCGAGCSLSITGTFSAATFQTATNCASAASPAVCGSAAAGAVVVAAGTTTVVVNTTAVTANSEILLTFDSSLGARLGVTCNTSEPALYGVTARVAATSFTISSSAPVTNPACFSYLIVN